MARLLRHALLASAVVAFLAVSVLLARLLAAAGTERSAAVELVEAEGRGDAQAVIEAIRGCRSRPPCRRRVTAGVAALPSGGTVRVLRLDGPPRLHPTSRTASARIVWRAGTRLPVVQCVRLRRAGDVLRGFDVQVLGISDPIAREASCRGR